MSIPVTRCTRPAIAAAVTLLLAACESGRTDTDAARQAQQTPPRTQELLQADAAMLKTQAPLQPMGMHLAGLAVLKDDSSQQLEAHYYCAQANPDLLQCAMFDSDATRARLIGVEYMISERVFNTLPEDERQYWHPHNYEILSGKLLAPDLPKNAELEFMRDRLNGYGKSWHFWNADNTNMPAEAVPLGPPQLMWSLSRDGQADPGLERALAEHTGMSLADRAHHRTPLAADAHSQAGEDGGNDASAPQAPAEEGSR